MGRAPCCDKSKVKRGPWSPEEDMKLKEYIEKYGTGGNWIALPQKVGLRRCGKSCRLRWLNYLRPNIKHGDFSEEEDRIICTLFATIGSRWSIIAAQLPGRTDNDIKNYWNTKLKKKLLGIPPSQRKSNQQTKHQHQEQQLILPSSNVDGINAMAPTTSSSSFQCLLFNPHNNVYHDHYQMKEETLLGFENNYIYGELFEDTHNSNLLGNNITGDQEASTDMYVNYGEIQDPSSTNISFRTQERVMCSSYNENMH